MFLEVKDTWSVFHWLDGFSCTGKEGSTAQHQIVILSAAALWEKKYPLKVCQSEPLIILYNQFMLCSNASIRRVHPSLEVLKLPITWHYPWQNEWTSRGLDTPQYDFSYNNPLLRSLFKIGLMPVCIQVTKAGFRVGVVPSLSWQQREKQCGIDVRTGLQRFVDVLCVGPTTERFTSSWQQLTANSHQKRSNRKYMQTGETKLGLGATVGIHNWIN